MEQLKIDLSEQEIFLLKKVLAEYILISAPTSVYYNPEYVDQAAEFFEKLIMAEATQ